MDTQPAPAPLFIIRDLDGGGFAGGLGRLPPWSGAMMRISEDRDALQPGLLWGVLCIRTVIEHRRRSLIAAVP